MTPHEQEIQKYIEVYRADPSYKMGGLRYKDAKQDIDEFDYGSTYLDVGCGRGEMVDYAGSIGLHAQGCDVVPHLIDGERVVKGDICNLPFYRNQFDYVSAFDVMEHVLPEDEFQALNELHRVAKRLVVIAVNNRRSYHPDTDNELHVNRKPYNVWEADFKQIFGGKNVIRVEGKQYVGVTFYCYP